MMDQLEYRKTLGRYPTGVALITALGPADEPIGMVVGTFSSVSLAPRLVSFMPDQGSTTFPAISHAGRFAVSVLGAEHAELCSTFARKNPDRWESAEWNLTGSGIPRLRNALLWAECRIVDVHEVGDHYIVVGEVEEIDVEGEGSPLVFFRGGYGQFAADSLVLRPETELIPQIRVADLARGEMESVARSTGLECVAQAVVGDELVLLASATPPYSDATNSHVGVRIPLLPPRGSLFAAWPMAESPWKKWLSASEADESLNNLLSRVRQRGWSVWLASEDAELNSLFDAVANDSISQDEFGRLSLAIDNLHAVMEPDDFGNGELAVRFLGAPVHGSDGAVVLVLRLLGLPATMSVGKLEELAALLVAAADRVTELSGGRKLLTEARLAGSAVPQ